MELKLMLMSTVEIRSEIDLFLDQVDESFLKVVHSMLNTYVRENVEDPIIGYDVDGKPLHASVARKLFEKELEGVKRGEYITIEDLEKESETW